MASPAERDNDEEKNISLPLDALRNVLSCLDSHSLSRCSCVSRAWNTLASEDALWQQQLTAEFYRPEILQPYNLLMHSTGSQHDRTDQHSQSSAAGSAAPAAEEAAGVAGRCRNATAALKELFASSKALPICQHQALLSRFHTALHSIHAWRLMIKLKPAAETHPIEHLEERTRHLAAATGSTSDKPTQHSTTANNSNSTSSSSSSRSSHGDDAAALNPENPKPLIGHPAPLNSSNFICGAVAGWCCGCVLAQQQEQSCWVRFRLPAELKTDVFLNGAAAGFGGLVASVQALGPSGWFDVATCDPFILENDDMDILLQSHKTGFYAWDQSEEDGPAKDGDLEPMAWDMTGDNWQQVLQQQQAGQQQQQQAPVAPGDLGQPDQLCQQQPQQATAAPVNLGQADQPPPQPDLRMLVYIHYEQLLQSLTWQLPQTLPIAKPPTFSSMAAVGRHLTNGPAAAAAAAALWLHLDVCQLQGGFRLGSCVTPLSLVRMGPQKVVFKAAADAVLVALYDPQSEKNSSSCDCSTQQQQQQHLNVLTNEACKLLLLGKQCIGGGSSSSTGVCSSEGLLIETAADALAELMARDEVMVDFALFDGQGHLLMGRAGVEVWTKECTSYHTLQHEQQQDAQPLQQQDDQLQQPPQQQQQQQQQQDAHHLEQQDHEPQPYHHQQQQQEAAVPLAAAAAAAGPIAHTRQLHMLHFLVDHVDSLLWENGITMDTAAAPEGVSIPLVSLALTWPALKGLFVRPEAKRQTGADVAGFSGGEGFSD